MTETPLALPNDLQRFFLDRFEPLPEQEAGIQQRVRGALEDWTQGRLREGEFADAFLKELAGQAKEGSRDLERFGGLVSLALVGKELAASGKTFRYRVNFENAAVLMEFQFDSDNKISGAQTKGVEWAAPAFFKN